MLLKHRILQYNFLRDWASISLSGIWKQNTDRSRYSLGTLLYHYCPHLHQSAFAAATIYPQNLETYNNEYLFLTFKLAGRLWLSWLRPDSGWGLCLCLSFCVFHSGRQAYKRVSRNTYYLLKLLLRTGGAPSPHVPLVRASHMAKSKVSEVATYKRDRVGRGGQMWKKGRPTMPCL